MKYLENLQCSLNIQDEFYSLMFNAINFDSHIALNVVIGQFLRWKQFYPLNLATKTTLFYPYFIKNMKKNHFG